MSLRQATLGDLRAGVVLIAGDVFPGRPCLTPGGKYIVERDGDGDAFIGCDAGGHLFQTEQDLIGLFLKQETETMRPEATTDRPPGAPPNQGSGGRPPNAALAEAGVALLLGLIEGRKGIAVTLLRDGDLIDGWSLSVVDIEPEPTPPTP